MYEPGISWIYLSGYLGLVSISSNYLLYVVYYCPVPPFDMLIVFMQKHAIGLFHNKYIFYYNPRHAVMASLYLLFRLLRTWVWGIQLF